MSSIIEGYNYDIFISYRQKDNKGDHWVSEFVEALETELESTFKEEISVYFDINPHDGLLETHDVDASLKEKLKCLIFIPIISRTYCDPNSFAWEHEFKAFVEMASKDQFGLKVKLPNGNVASRVLPVRIHDLDQVDIKECESVLGNVLRGIEFIYKEPGVNRPLMPSEAHPDNNLNKNIYRNQINKVANSIKEIIAGLRGEQTTGTQVKPVSKNENTGKKILAGFLFLLVLGTGIYLFILKSGKQQVSTKDPIALNFYERGNEYYDRFIRTRSNVTLNMADTSFRKAINRDPRFAEAYVGLAAVIYRKSNADDISKSDYLDSVMIMCNQAITIKKHIPDAYAYLGFYHSALKEIQKSEEQFNMALEQDPQNFLAFLGLGYLYQETDPLKSIINFQKAMSLDNDSYCLRILNALSQIYRSTGFNDKAKEIYEEIYKFDKDYSSLNLNFAINEYSAGNYPESYNYALKSFERDRSYGSIIMLGLTSFLLNDFEKSLKYYEMAFESSSASGYLLWQLHRIAYCYFGKGMNEKGDSCLNKMSESLNNLKFLGRSSGYVNRPYYDLACFYAVKGDKEREIQNLKLYFDQIFINLDMLNLLKKDPLLNSIRDDEEYKTLVNELDRKFIIQHDQIKNWLDENNLLLKVKT